MEQGKSQEETLEILAARSRDDGRTPMQWDGQANAGFSQSEPWIPMGDTSQEITVEKQLGDETSILSFYKKLVALRKELPVIARGDIAMIEAENADVLAYRRTLDDQELIVWNNLTGGETEVGAPEGTGWKLVLGNYEDGQAEGNADGRMRLRPYETVALGRNL